MKNKLKRAIGAIKKVSEAVTENALTAYSAQSSYYILFAIVPLLMLTFAAARYVIPISPSDAAKAIEEYIPSTFAPLFNSLADEFFDKNLTAVFAITAVTSLWTLSRAIAAISSALDKIYGLNAARSLLRLSVISVIYAVAFFAVMVFMLLFIVYGSAVQGLFTQHAPLLEGIVTLLFNMRPIITLCLLTLFFGAVYTLFPARRLRFKKQIPGALFTASGWIIFSWLFSIYVENFSKHSYIYGSLTTLILFLLWVYSCHNIMFFGAMINVYLIKNGGITHEKANSNS